MSSIRIRGNQSEESKLRLLDSIHIDDWVVVTLDIPYIIDDCIIENEYEWVNEIKDIDKREVACSQIRSLQEYVLMQMRMRDHITNKYPKYEVIELECYLVDNDVLNIKGELGLFSNGGELDF
jgi:hypothetical protein